MLSPHRPYRSLVAADSYADFATELQVDRCELSAVPQTINKLFQERLLVAGNINQESIYSPDQAGLWQLPTGLLAYH